MKIIFLAIISQLLISCAPQHDPEPQIHFHNDDPRLNFQWLNKNVFEPKCATCHAGTRPDGNLKLEKYEDLLRPHPEHGLIIKPKQLFDSAFWREIIAKKMPPKNSEQLTFEEKALIEKWILIGAPEFGKNQSKVEEEKLEPHFDSLWKGVFKNKCANCHGLKKPKGKPPLILWDYCDFVTKNPDHGWIVLPNGSLERSGLWKVINLPLDEKEKMPPTKSKQLTVDDVATIRQWILRKAPKSFNSNPEEDYQSCKNKKNKETL